MGVLKQRDLLVHLCKAAQLIAVLGHQHYADSQHSQPEQVEGSLTAPGQGSTQRCQQPSVPPAGMHGPHQGRRGRLIDHRLRGKTHRLQGNLRNPALLGEGRLQKALQGLPEPLPHGGKAVQAGAHLNIGLQVQAVEQGGVVTGHQRVHARYKIGQHLRIA
ncbi:hypothetical protein D3C77_563460 [compost metagenome]